MDSKIIENQIVFAKNGKVIFQFIQNQSIVIKKSNFENDKTKKTNQMSFGC
jgi:hypothetical protein